MSDRWWRRKRRRDRWFNDFFAEADKVEKNLDEIVRRALANAAEKEGARRRFPSQVANHPPPHTFSTQINERYEPLIDVFVNEDYVVVVIELLGVDKNSIDLHATEDKLMVSVNLQGSEFSREISLPARVDVKSSTSTLRNGVLEIRLKKLGKKIVLG